jgi:hypothetical protein
LQLFRGTNRFSIWILALVLLFLVRQLTILCRHKPAAFRAVLALLIASLALFDEIPVVAIDGLNPEKQRADREVIASDRVFVKQLESSLPPGSMIFQLPVIDYPESVQPGTMTDYEHFRPYLHSHNLRYSYGSDKGRLREGWQRDVERDDAPSMKTTLENYGFTAVYINKHGYVDGAKALIEGLRAAGCNEVIDSPRGDLVCLMLHPSPHPVLPPVSIFDFGKGWYGQESNGHGQKWRWSNGNAELNFYNESNSPRNVNLSLEMLSHRVSRHLDIGMNGRSILQTTLGTELKLIGPLVIRLQPGRNSLQLKTAEAPVPAGGGDPRQVTFAVYHITVE